MEKTRKSTKILSLLLSLAMLIGVVGVGMTASAAPEASGQQAVSTDKTAKAGTVPSTLTVKVIATGDKTYMGYGPTSYALNEPTTSATLRNYAPCKSFTMKQGEEYILYMTAQQSSWYLNTYNDCVILKLTASGLQVLGGEFNWYPGIVEKQTCNYAITVSGADTVEVRYQANAGTKTFTGDDFTTVDVEGLHMTGYYVPDTVSNEWAALNHDLALSADGAERQAFSVNSVKNLLAAWGAPARTVAPEFQSKEVQDYYNQSKVDNAKYMKHETYQYSEYFLHDFYAQGVWDAMPATYGWMQDEYTTPGKVIMAKHPEIQGLAYGIALGGQNPYVLCNFLERLGDVVGEDGTYENSTPNPLAVEKGFTNANGWFAGYDEVAETAYLWNPDEGVFLGYENERAWQARADYINDKNLAGVILWEISGDDKEAYDMTNLFKTELKDKGKQVIAYFCNWSVYNKYHQEQTPKDLPWDALTVVNYSFFQIGGYDTGTKDTPATPLSANEVHTIDAWADDYSGQEGGDGAPNMLLEMQEYAAQHSDVKVLFSIGGWTRGDGFAEAVETSANRQTLINSILAFMDKYTFFSGVDLDWEYPGIGSRDPDFDDCADMGCPNSSNDWKNYADFVAELRTALDSKYKSSGRNMITACFPAAPEKLAKQDVVRLAQNLDYLNMMTYDYHGAFDPTIGYNNLLYAHPETPDEWCTDNTVKAVLGYGVPSSKVNIGAGLYSRGWAGVIPDQDMNPQPLQDPTPIFGATVVEEDFTIEDVLVSKGNTDTVKVNPTGHTITSWKIDNTDVATVSNGVVTGVSFGTTKITATDSNGKTATATVTVTNDVVMLRNATKAYLNGTIYPTTQYGDVYASLKVVNGTSMLPLRYIAEVNGFIVDYLGGGQTKITNPNTKDYLIVSTGNSVMVKYLANGGSQTFNAPAAVTTEDSITVVPMRAICEALGLGVSYQSTSHGTYVVVSSYQAIDSELSKVNALIEEAYSKGL